MPVTWLEEDLGPATAPPHKKWTREECEILEKAGLAEAHRYELIEGEVVLKVGKKNPHMRAVLLLTNWLRSVFGNLHVLQEPSIDVSPQDHHTSEPEPDAAVLTKPFLEYPGQAPATDIVLVAEVSSTTLAFDLTTKAGLYARAGIPEYWVLDVARRRVIVHRDPVGGKYRSIESYQEQEPVSPLHSPQSSILVAQLF
jgi:Uma2 family endonuclease